MLVYWSATAKKPPKSDLPKVIFLVRETFGKTATCQVPKQLVKRFRGFIHPEQIFSILKKIYPLIPCEKGPFLKGPQTHTPNHPKHVTLMVVLNYVAICKNHFGYLPINFDPLPEPPNNHFLVDVW